MNILMIGNGFDLEHDLPTKYTDFLKFVEDFKRAYNLVNAASTKLCNLKNEYLKLAQIVYGGEFYLQLKNWKEKTESINRN